MVQKEEPRENPWRFMYKPAKLPGRITERETIIRESKRILERGIIERPKKGQLLLDYTEDLREDIERRKFAVRQLGKFGETDYLINMKTRYEMALDNARKLLKATTDDKLNASIQLGSRAYGQLRKQISKEEWEKLPKKKQDRMMQEAGFQVVGPVMERYDAEIKRLEDKIRLVEQVIAEMEKTLPSPTKDKLF